MTDARVPRRPPYGPINTLLLGILLCGVAAVAQVAAMGVYVAAHMGSKPSPGAFATMVGRGDVLSIATCACAIAVSIAIVVLVLVRRGPSLVDYLALRAVSRRTVVLTAALAIGLAVFSDVFLTLLGRPTVHPSMRHALQTSGNLLPLLGVAAVLAGPLWEELFFRGFLYRGWLGRMAPWLLALLTAMLWAALHVQYGVAELFTMSCVFWRSASCVGVRTRCGHRCFATCCSTALLPSRHFFFCETAEQAGFFRLSTSWQCTLRASYAGSWNSLHMGRARQLLTKVAETDRSFVLRDVRGKQGWVGPCVHCKRAIFVPVGDGQPASATLEHIVPRTHGGTDELDNLALACGGCNHAKGRNLDWRHLDDPTLQRVIERLRAARRERMR